MLNSASKLDSRSTSAILTALGSGAPTKTLTGCFASIFRRAPTWPDTPVTTSTRSLSHSTTGPVKPSDGEHPPKHSTSTYDQSNKAVLQRPLEPEQIPFIRTELASLEVVDTIVSGRGTDIEPPTQLTRLVHELDRPVAVGDPHTAGEGPEPRCRAPVHGCAQHRIRDLNRKRSDPSRGIWIS